MKSKGQRFVSSGAAGEASVRPGAAPGPGSYNAHTHRTIQTFLAAKSKLTSRQNPGFGSSSSAHKLPHEVEIANDEKAFVEKSRGAAGGGAGGAYGASPTGASSFTRPPPTQARTISPVREDMSA